MVRWMRTRLGRPGSGWDETVEFWSGVTRTTPAPSGDDDVLLLPASGAPQLGLTRAHDAPAIELDIVADDAESLARKARDLGASVRAADSGGFDARSPGGLPFHVVAEPGDFAEPPVLEHRNGARSSLDQVCIDIGRSDWDTEVAFWAGLTGLDPRDSARPEYRWIKAPDGRAFRLLLQRLDEQRPTGAHLDFACSDVSAVREVHIAAGARAGAEFPWWTVMYEPSGAVYCLTARDPVTGTLPTR